MNAEITRPPYGSGLETYPVGIAREGWSSGGMEWDDGRGMLRETRAGVAAPRYERRLSRHSSAPGPAACEPLAAAGCWPGRCRSLGRGGGPAKFRAPRLCSWATLPKYSASDALGLRKAVETLVRRAPRRRDG